MLLSKSVQAQSSPSPLNSSALAPTAESKGCRPHPGRPLGVSCLQGDPCPARRRQRRPYPDGPPEKAGRVSASGRAGSFHFRPLGVCVAYARMDGVVSECSARLLQQVGPRGTSGKVWRGGTRPGCSPRSVGTAAARWETVLVPSDAGSQGSETRACAASDPNAFEDGLPGVREEPVTPRPVCMWRSAEYRVLPSPRPPYPPAPSVSGVGSWPVQWFSGAAASLHTCAFSGCGATGKEGSGVRAGSLGPGLQLSPPSLRDTLNTSSPKKGSGSLSSKLLVKEQSQLMKVKVGQFHHYLLCPGREG